MTTGLGRDSARSSDGEIMLDPESPGPGRAGHAPTELAADGTAFELRVRSVSADAGSRRPPVRG
ncbi:hypothetical protein, partial [Streptomyces sp. NPDC127084]|uniref:hypothetical protein n=1 Tax=Streptomyces sp. NPDC127084 TaxID=3347133 RepID=UPI00365D472E